jgi:UDP-N-acetyl-D-mannosaminuronic acid transferase (WecB/TagA/CpsF family)
MPREDAMNQNIQWLQSRGIVITKDDCYIAPMYPQGVLTDDVLSDLIVRRQPRHIILSIGGGVQERLGAFLRSKLNTQTTIYCTGAALGFLTGEQASIPDWADRFFLGWFMRCVADPKRFIPRYLNASRLPLMMAKYRERLPVSAPR